VKVKAWPWEARNNTSIYVKNPLKKKLFAVDASWQVKDGGGRRGKAGEGGGKGKHKPVSTDSLKCHPGPFYTLRVDRLQGGQLVADFYPSGNPTPYGPGEADTAAEPRSHPNKATRLDQQGNKCFGHPLQLHESRNEFSVNSTIRRRIEKT
jgi:hypothetical protein